MLLDIHLVRRSITSCGFISRVFCHALHYFYYAKCKSTVLKTKKPKAITYANAGLPSILIIIMTSYWARWRLKSPAFHLFAQSFVEAQIKENIKAPRQWTLWWESTCDRWIHLTKGQLRGKCLHLMTSSWLSWFDMLYLVWNQWIKIIKCR